MKRHMAVKLTFALALVAILGLAASPSFGRLQIAPPENGVWVGNCPTSFANPGTIGPVVRSCQEVNYTMGCVRVCEVVNVNGSERKTNCNLSD